MVVQMSVTCRVGRDEALYSQLVTEEYLTTSVSAAAAVHSEEYCMECWMLIFQPRDFVLIYPVFRHPAIDSDVDWATALQL